jgi:hypothetical protein
MAKTHSLPFDLSSIALAFSTAEAHANAFDAMTAEMLQWFHAGVFPASADIKVALVQAGRRATTAAVYASAILKWARSGKTPASLHKCVGSNPPDHVKSKAGRPAKQGAGKTTAVGAKGSIAAPLLVAATESQSPMHRWVVQANALSAAAFMLRNAKNETMNTDDAKALQDAANLIAALLGKYTK